MSVKETARQKIKALRKRRILNLLQRDVGFIFPCPKTGKNTGNDKYKANSAKTAPFD